MEKCENSEQSHIYGPIDQILTMERFPERGPIADSEIVIIEKGGIRVAGERIVEVGPFATICRDGDRRVEVEGPSVAIPGFIDVHTHICWGGTRAGDYAKRLAGASYQEIAAAGGGILDTVKNTRRATLAELSALIRQRMRKHMKRGVTTCEVKSGYGLTVEDEIKMLQAIADAADKEPLTVVSTCLAAHTSPPEFGDSRSYLSHIKEHLLPEVKKKKLSQRVDIFIEKGAFSCDEALEYLSFAKNMGFCLTAHVDQFTKGGSLVAADVGALSADHLEETGEYECRRLLEAGVIPVVLPGASLGLGSHFAKARMFLDEGLPLVIASDWNPGSAPHGGLLTQAAFLGAAEKLTMAETFAALTTRAARALLLEDRGELTAGLRADFLLFPTSDYREILYNQGEMMPKEVVIAGRSVFGS